MDKKIRPIYMMPPRDPSQNERYTQTKSKGMKTDMSCRWKEKKAGIAIFTSKKIDPKKICSNRQRRTLHNDMGNNLTREYYPSKHLCMQHRST